MWQARSRWGRCDNRRPIFDFPELNYRHAFHAGNHADALKHIVLLALCDALTAKPAACFALDTHAGRGLYDLNDAQAVLTGESSSGISRLQHGDTPQIDRYLNAVHACRGGRASTAYPGSPWLLAHALRAQDQIACCELQPQEAAALKIGFAADPRVSVHLRDGYAALKALLPPRSGATKFARGMVLIDPPYEAQLMEFDLALAALREGLKRWPQGIFALWYPIKQRAALARFYRQAGTLPAKSAFVAELLVRNDDSPLRLNGSGMLLLNPPWGLDRALAPTLNALCARLSDNNRGNAQLHWLRAAA